MFFLFFLGDVFGFKYNQNCLQAYAYGKEPFFSQQAWSKENGKSNLLKLH